MAQNPNTNIVVEQQNDYPIGGVKALLGLKGKLWIAMEQGGKMIGFKFIIGTTFPQHPPIAFLDEPIIPSLFEFFDYLKPGNLLDFAYLHEWRSMFQSNPVKYNLQAPPVPFEDVEQPAPLQPQPVFYQPPPQIPAPQPAPRPQQASQQEFVWLPPPSKVPQKKKLASIDEDPLGFLIEKVLAENGDDITAMTPEQRDIIIQKTIEAEQGKVRPEVLTKLKPMVEGYVSDQVYLGRSEMEHNLSKYVRFVRRQDELEKTISAIKTKNAQIKEKTEQIEKQVEQMAPAVEALNMEKLDGDSVFEHFQTSQSPFVLKALEINSKIHGLEDCMNALKLNESIPVNEVLKHIRKLSNKQYKLIIKRSKLIEFIRLNPQIC
ncbi:hypothetical protein FGO68_gene5969 [Halteria grandinella]|uniref:Uncharacterized protein n=1 Tax=Halteria grandinella TaxID=5974 RepID=A0A8J8T246_HALGN|nr:hypothetical protein FGO68_gene5969 [Halteria grandinella]